MKSVNDICSRRDIALQRLQSQQLIRPRFDNISELVSHFGIIQAQDFKMVRWAVAMRTKHPSLRDFIQAFDKGEIVRTHLCRCTWQLTTPQDLGWLLTLRRERNRRAVVGFMAYNGVRITEDRIDAFEYDIVEILTGRASVCKNDIIDALVNRGWKDDRHTLSSLLSLAEIDGLICSGKYDENQNTYALIKERFGELKTIERDNAIKILVDKYFRSHAPATLDDFVWWSNLPVGECRKAIASLSDVMSIREIDGETYYYHNTWRDARAIRSGGVILLPSYDELLIGYKSRHHTISVAHKHRAHNSFGIFYPLIIKDGHAIGNWKCNKLLADFFKPEYEIDMTKAVSRYTRFCDAE